MGLLDFLSGNSDPNASTDPNAMGPPAPYQPTLFDKLGGMFGGVSQVDPTMAAQLGIDPGKLQHQLAMQALMRMGAGMAAGGAPHNGHTPTIWEAMAAGSNAAQQGGQDQLHTMLSQAMQSKQLSIAQQQQARLDAQNKANDALTESLKNGQLDPNFVSAMGMDEGSLRALATADPTKFTSMLTNWNTGNAAAARQDAKDTAAGVRQDARDKMLEEAADRRAAAALAAQGRLPPIMNAMTPEQKQAYLDHEAGITRDPTTGAIQAGVTKQDQIAINKRVPELQDGITKAQAALDAIDSMSDAIKNGTYGQSGVGRAMRNATGIPALQGTGVVDMNKDAANLVLTMQAAQASKGNRNSVLGLTTLRQGKPEPGAPDDANLHGLATGRADIQRLYDNMTAEQDHLSQPGNTLQTWAAAAKAMRGSGARSAGGAGAGAAGGDGTHVVGQTYVDGNGKQAKYLGNGQWQEL